VAARWQLAGTFEAKHWTSSPSEVLAVDNSPPVPRVVAAYVDKVEESTGVRPTATRVGFSRWQVELRTDRVYATGWWREDRRRGRTAPVGGGVLEVDGKSRKVAKLRELADIIRYPDGKPVTLEPMTKEFDPAKLPTLIRGLYETVQDELESRPGIAVRVGSGRIRHEIDLAIDVDEVTGIRLAFRKTGGRWDLCDKHVLVVVDGVDRSQEVRGQGADAAVGLLMTATSRPAVPTTVGSPATAKTVPTSVQVRNTAVIRN
jgi:hypothetical protein